MKFFLETGHKHSQKCCVHKFCIVLNITMTKFRKLDVLVDKFSILGTVRVELIHRNGAEGCRIFHTGLQKFLLMEKSIGMKALRVFPENS